MDNRTLEMLKYKDKENDRLKKELEYYKNFSLELINKLQDIVDKNKKTETANN